MCAVAGILSATPLDAISIFAMTGIQRHRGPDGSGHILFGGDKRSKIIDSPDELESENSMAQVALGHRRLSILDISAASRQPMAYANKRFWLTYNGEIYNYLELREELQGLGHSFSTTGDTEVVLAAFAEWGKGCFARFDGMWSMAFWDQEKRELTLSRDRFGEKPLYYSTANGALIFASEIKALFASGMVRPELDQATAFDFFRFESLNHSNRSFFRNVHSLPAGSFAVISLDNPSEVVAEPYWELRASESGLNFEQATEQFRTLFRTAVTRRMRSDVAVGTCLSGGLDSSAITCQMSQLAASQISTFTSGSSETDFDESRWAKLVSDSLGTRAYRTTLCMNTMLEDLDALVWHQEEPFNSVGTFAQWQLMRCAREAGVTVLLDGQGADEILMGYKKFYMWHLRSLASSGHWLSAANHAAGFAIRGDRGVFRWREGMRYLPESIRPKGYSLGDYILLDQGSKSKSFHSTDATTGLMQRQMDDLTRFSLPVLLRHEDRNSMAWSVESRVPFLDHRLVEFLLGLPVDFKLRAGQTKAILRKAFSGSLPDSILNRRDKMGYATPQSIWMQGALGERMLEELNESKLAASLLDVEQLSARWTRGSESIRARLQSTLFRAGVFSAWARRFEVQ